MKYLFILLFISTAFKAIGQEKIQRLLVSEYGVDTYIVHLMAYNFKNGVYISKDTILNGTEKIREKTPYNIGFRSSLIYKNRYVVARFGGGVYDMKTKKTMFKPTSRLNLASQHGDTLVYYAIDANTGTSYFSLDLISGEYTENNEYTPRYGLESPDKKHHLTINKRKSSHKKICLNDQEGNQRILVEDAGFGIYTKGSQSPTVETYWLNNHSFLYTLYECKKEGNQKGFCTVYLRKYDINESIYLKFHRHHV